MIAIDTEEKLNWLLNVLENNELQVVRRERTAEEYEEIRREIAEYKAMRQENNKVGKEAILV